MGNKNSTHLSNTDKPLMRITPKLPLMRLSSTKSIRHIGIKTESNTSSNHRISSDDIRTIRNSRMSVPDEKSSLKWPKAVFKMIETVSTDTPCDMEEERENTEPSPFKEKSDSWKGRRTYSSKTPVNPPKKDLDFKRRNALRTQHKLMQALFDTEICSSCLRPLVDKGVWLKNTCGHVFHANCAAGIDNCPECRKSMNTIEII